MQKRKIHILPAWFSALIALLFMMHFGLVLVHQFGKERLPQNLVMMADRYIVPWFYQNYLMFAPDPANSINSFLYRVETDEGWSSWKNPVFPYQQMHWANRLGYGSDVYDLYNGMADELYNGAHLVSFLEHPEKEDWFSVPVFPTVEQFMTDSLLHQFDGVRAFQVGVFTEHHRVEDGKILRYEVFQPYPSKRFSDD